MKNGEKGQALPAALILVAFGGLVIAPFLSHAGTGMIGSRLYQEAISEQYSADAGVEHAIWDLVYDDLADQMPLPGDSYSYQLSETINGIAANITVFRGWDTIASDNFESGNWSGGNGWLDDWYASGDASVTPDNSPYKGTYHLMLRSTDGYAKRSVDLSEWTQVNLQFWGRARSFEGDEEAYCRVSENGVDWTTVHTWAVPDDDNEYHFFDIDLSPYSLTSEFWIAFSANMSGTGDYLYIDNLAIVWDCDAVAPIAKDYFESGDFTGGTGWLWEWWYEGDASVVTGGSPYEGNYHLRLRRDTGYVDRAVDLSAYTEARLQFWAKANSFESGETADCLISENGVDWVVVYTWTNTGEGGDGVDDNIYHFCDIDLSVYNLTSEFWIAFDAEMSGTADYLYIDYLKICEGKGWGITAVADDETIRATVEIVGETVNVLWWEVV